jgi:ribosomal protein S18 acetylase RimI-like enzyme
MVSIPLEKQIILRHAAHQDLPALEWEGEFTHFRHVFAEAYRLKELGDVIMWVAELPDFGLIGQLFIQLYGPNQIQANVNKYAYIYGFRIRPVYQGKGVGSRMLETAESDLVRRGFQRIALNVAQDNEAARRLYERRGYQVIAPEPGIWSYLDDKGRRRFVNEPAWRMEKQF